VIRRIVVFSGFDGAVVERLRPMLAAQQTEVVVVKLAPHLDQAYFDRLFARFWQVASGHLADPAARWVGLLASAAEAAEEEMERAAFFPMLRRHSVERRRARDVNAATRLGNELIALLTGSDFLVTYRRVKPAPDAVLALPIENCPASRLRNELQRLYNMDAFEPAPALDRFIQRLKKGGGLRARALTFKGCTNDPKHPVRRVTDSDRCDAESRFRLGFSIPARFEFDVSCETGLTGKTFYCCDGGPVRITKSPSHLNMRINGDFTHP
jgi:hypothetical protein